MAEGDSDPGLGPPGSAGGGPFALVLPSSSRSAPLISLSSLTWLNPRFPAPLLPIKAPVPLKVLSMAAGAYPYGCLCPVPVLDLPSGTVCSPCTCWLVVKWELALGNSLEPFAALWQILSCLKPFNKELDD